MDEKEIDNAENASDSISRCRESEHLYQNLTTDDESSHCASLSNEQNISNSECSSFSCSSESELLNNCLTLFEQFSLWKGENSSCGDCSSESSCSKSELLNSSMTCLEQNLNNELSSDEQSNMCFSSSEEFVPSGENSNERSVKKENIFKKNLGSFSILRDRRVTLYIGPENLKCDKYADAYHPEVDIRNNSSVVNITSRRSISIGPCLRSTSRDPCRRSTSRDPCRRSTSRDPCRRSCTSVAPITYYQPQSIYREVSSVPYYQMTYGLYYEEVSIPYSQLSSGTYSVSNCQSRSRQCCRFCSRLCQSSCSAPRRSSCSGTCCPLLLPYYLSGVRATLSYQTELSNRNTSTPLHQPVTRRTPVSKQQASQRPESEINTRRGIVPFPRRRRGRYRFNWRYGATTRGRVVRVSENVQQTYLKLINEESDSSPKNSGSVKSSTSNSSNNTLMKNKYSVLSKTIDSKESIKSNNFDYECTYSNEDLVRLGGGNKRLDKESDSVSIELKKNDVTCSSDFDYVNISNSRSVVCSISDFSDNNNDRPSSFQHYDDNFGKNMQSDASSSYKNREISTTTLGNLVLPIFLIPIEKP